MTAKKAAKPKVAKNAAPPEVVVAYKGFDANLVCNPTGEKPFQYAIGETYHHNGEVVRCAEGGFHACENPIEVFGYYAPAGSRYCLVEASGAVDRDSDDTKIACGSITIKAELKLPELIIRAIDWVTARIDKSIEQTLVGNTASNTGNRSAASNTGDYSAASNTGYQSAASNTGDYSAASNTGYRSAASNTGYQSAASNTGDYSAASNTGDRSAASNAGYQSAASNTGYQSAASNTGDYSAASNAGYQSAASVAGAHSVAISSGIGGKARASAGSAVVLCYRNDDGELLHIRAAIAGQGGVKPDTWYSLGAAGEFVEVSE